ncbi:acyl carrier protein [Streptomyces chartreusis]|uniref:acyl carrier protein n=1 Tax=Streptomyces chartreusis TaxID=1969 RepID=UPI003655D043
MSNASLNNVDGTAGASEDERVEQVLAIVREVLCKPGIGADDEVMDHGGTSLSIVRILAESSHALKLDINPRDLGGTVTARNLARAAR